MKLRVVIRRPISPTHVPTVYRSYSAGSRSISTAMRDRTQVESLLCRLRIPNPIRVRVFAGGMQNTVAEGDDRGPFG